MASEKAETKRAFDAFPEVLGDEKENIYVSAHDLTTDVDPAYEGEYQLIHGCIRIPVSDGKGGFIVRGKVFRGPQYEDVFDENGKPVIDKKTGKQAQKQITQGAKLRLNALDAYRMLQVGVVKRIDGKRPDRIEKTEAA